MKLSKSAKYYRSNPEARKKKASTDKKINARKSQIKKRVEANRANRKAKSKKGDRRDYDHKVGGFVPQSVNRGRAGEGGRKKGRAHNGRSL